MTKREVWENIEYCSLKIDELEMKDHGGFDYRDNKDFWYDLSSRLHEKYNTLKEESWEKESGQRNMSRQTCQLL